MCKFPAARAVFRIVRGELGGGLAFFERRAAVAVGHQEPGQDQTRRGGVWLKAHGFAELGQRLRMPLPM